MSAVDIESIRTLNSKPFAETVELQAETENLRRATRYCPVFVGAGSTAAATGLAGVVLKSFGA